MKKNSAAFTAKLFQYRHSGIHGTPIPMHRSLRRIPFTYSALLAIIILPIFFNLLLWVNMDSITSLWANIFDFWISKLQLDGYVFYASVDFIGQKLAVPFPDLATSVPLQSVVWGNILVSLLLIVLTNLIPKNYLPATYLLRAALLIQISASIYFIFKPESPPYALSNYIPGMLTLGLYLTMLVSPLLAMIYYIFDFPFWQKFTVTFLMIGYFIIVLPFQYMFHAVVISSGSMLFMPVLYLLFGVLLNTFMFVGCYAWAMTLDNKRPLTR